VALAACGEVSVPIVDAQPGGPPDGRPSDGPSGGEPDARPPGCEGGVFQLLTNPGFDEAQQPNGAIGWTEVTVPITYPEDQIQLAAQSPKRAAWFGDVLRREQRLFQEVAVPPETVALVLTLYRCFVTEESPAEPFDQVAVSLIDSSGGVLEELARYTNQDAVESPAPCVWSKTEFLAEDSHAGEEIAVEIHGQSDGATLTSFFFDTLELNATAPCPDAGAW
jgi:hypothetical protein